jgi:hypothetical protein
MKDGSWGVAVEGVLGLLREALEEGLLVLVVVVGC